MTRARFPSVSRQKPGPTNPPIEPLRSGSRLSPGRRIGLALFCWPSPQLPDPRHLRCTSHFPLGGRMVPEFDRFGLFSHEEAVARVGKDMARLLAAIPLDTLCGASD